MGGTIDPGRSVPLSSGPGSMHERGDGCTSIDELIGAIEMLALHVLERSLERPTRGDPTGYGRVYVGSPSYAMRRLLYRKGWRRVPPSQRLPGTSDCMYSDEPIRTPAWASLPSRILAAEAFCRYTGALDPTHGDFFTWPVVIVPTFTADLSRIGRDSLEGGKPYDRLFVAIPYGMSTERVVLTMRANRTSACISGREKPAWMIEEEVTENMATIGRHLSLLGHQTTDESAGEDFL